MENENNNKKDVQDEKKERVKELREITNVKDIEQKSIKLNADGSLDLQSLIEDTNKNKRIERRDFNLRNIQINNKSGTQTVTRQSTYVNSRTTIYDNTGNLDDDEADERPSKLENDELESEDSLEESENSLPNDTIDSNNNDNKSSNQEGDLPDEEASGDGGTKKPSTIKEGLKKLVKSKFVKSPYFWLVIIILIIIFLIIMYIWSVLYSRKPSLESILCGGDSDFDDLKVITTTQKMKRVNGQRYYTEPLDSWDFYDYVKAVLRNEYSASSDTSLQSAYQAQAVAAASFAVDRGGYYSRLETNKEQFQEWCGSGQEWVSVGGRKTFKCPSDWNEYDDIIILPNSTDAQTACSVSKGCYVYVASNDSCKVDVYKTIEEGYTAPETWTKKCSDGVEATANKKVKEALSADKIEIYDKIIEKIKGVFLTDASGKIGYGRYGAAGTPGCSGEAGETMAMCHDHRGYDDIGTQSSEGWSALRILTFWYKDAYLSSKSSSGISLCEAFKPSMTANLPKLNWTDSGATHVADPSFKLENFLKNASDSKQYNLTVNDFNNTIYSVVKGYGVGTRMGVVGAATTLISTFQGLGVRLPYDLGGSYYRYGINPRLGEDGGDVPISYDCTGFFYWSMRNGGVDSGTWLLKKLTGGDGATGNNGYFQVYDGRQKAIGVVGDAIYHRYNGQYVHAMLVIGHEFDQNGVCISNIVAESAGGGKGVVFSSYDLLKGPRSKADFPYGIVNTQECFDGKGGCRIDNDDNYYKGVLKDEIE